MFDQRGHFFFITSVFDTIQLGKDPAGPVVQVVYIVLVRAVGE